MNSFFINLHIIKMISSHQLRILTIGDIHFKTNNVKETQDMCDKILELLSREHVDLIFVMGDTLDRHENIHVVPFTQSIKFIEQLSKLKKTYLLIGNHDRPNNADFLSDYHPFNGLKGKDNLIVVDNVISTKHDNINILSVPYVFPGRFMEAINTNKDVNIKEIDITLDEQDFCKKCSPDVNSPVLYLIIKYDDNTVHKAKNINSEDVKLITEFLNGQKIHKLFNEEEIPLKDYISRLEYLLGIKI